MSFVKSVRGSRPPQALPSSAMKWILGIIVGCCVALPLKSQERQEGRLPPPPGAMVDVGGRRIHLLCTGSGSPTIVFEAGASSFAIDFTLVQRDVARSNRVCSYDRAGMGWSDAATDDNRRSVARDLHDALTAAGERPPYVLVGASRGGLYIRTYQADYPAEVGGMVFLDPATEDRLFTMIGERMVAIAKVSAEELSATNPTRPVAVPRRRPQTGAPFDRLPSDLYRTRILLDEKLIASPPDTVGPDVVARFREAERRLLARLDSLRNLAERPLGDLPVVVLSRGDDTNEGRVNAHRAVAAQSRNAYHCVVADAGHEIHLFKPEAVVQAIASVVQAIRSRTTMSGTQC